MDICGTSYDVDDPEVFCRQLVGVSMHGPQAEAEAACMIALDHEDLSVRRIALTSTGHSARVNRAVSDALLARAIAALDDPELRGSAMNALDDVAIFVFNDRRGWKSVPGVGSR